MTGPPIRVLVTEDHAMVRDLLRTRLEAEDGIEVVAVAETADAAVRKARELRPDVVLLDIEMPGLSSFEGAREIQATCPEIRIIFVTAFIHDSYIQQALELEGAGYVTKYEQPASVIDAVRTVMEGGVYFSPEVRNRICMDHSGARLGDTRSTPISLLTPRERAVLVAVARGLSNKEIAEELHISVKTVEHHCTHLMAKLDIHDRVHLARFAIREGMATA